MGWMRADFGCGRILIDAQRVGAAATQKSYSAQLTAHFALAHLNSCVALVCDAMPETNLDSSVLMPLVC